MSEDDGPPDLPPSSPPPEAPDGPRGQAGGPGPPPPRLRLIHFPRAAEEEPQPEGGLVIPGKPIVPADCITPLKQALASAQAGNVAALALVGVYADGSEMFFVAANGTTFTEILGALEIVKSTVVAAALEHYEINSPKLKG